MGNVSLVGRPPCYRRSWCEQRSWKTPAGKGVNATESSSPMEWSPLSFFFQPYIIQLHSQWQPRNSFLNDRSIALQVTVHPLLPSYKFQYKLSKNILRNERGTKCVEIHLSNKQHDWRKATLANDLWQCFRKM